MALWPETREYSFPDDWTKGRNLVFTLDAHLSPTFKTYKTLFVDHLVATEEEQRWWNNMFSHITALAIDKGLKPWRLRSKDVLDVSAAQAGDEQLTLAYLNHKELAPLIGMWIVTRATNQQQKASTLAASPYTNMQSARRVDFAVQWGNKIICGAPPTERDLLERCILDEQPEWPIDGINNLNAFLWPLVEAVPSKIERNIPYAGFVSKEEAARAIELYFEDHQRDMRSYEQDKIKR